MARPREGAEELFKLINQLPPQELNRRQRAIERSLYQMGITFTVYNDDQGTEKIMPFDVVPRVISSMLWRHIEAGLKQRIRALNHFLADIYHEQQIVGDGVIPRELSRNLSPTFLPQCVGLKPWHDVWCHITGTDLVRDDSGAVYVLEDNLRCPSGVSYVLAEPHGDEEKLSPTVVRCQPNVRPVADYPARLLRDAA